MMTLNLVARPSAVFRYDGVIEDEIARLAEAIGDTPALAAVYPARWLAIQLLEGEAPLIAAARATGGDAIVQLLEASAARLRDRYGDDLDIAIADQRYRFAHDLVGQVLARPDTPVVTVSDRIDRVVTHRWLGIPIFLAMMWIVFKLTTDLARPFVDWIGDVIGGPLSRWAAALLALAGQGGSWVERLLVDGVIAGVGGVLAFVPVLMALYLALAVLEDSGYMARAAFVMDRLMRALGLHGKSFLPLIVGFGCSVPAIYATRTLDQRRDRILTGLLAPFMSCSARLPVYVLIAAVFFPASGGLVIFSLYMAGIVVAIGLGFLLKHTLFHDAAPAPFVLELPPYRLPSPRGIGRQMWDRTASFLRRAATLILAASVVVWLLMAVPIGAGRFAQTDVAESLFAGVAGAVAPIFAPLGFGSWETSGALASGLVAKEVVVGTMVQTFHVAGADAPAAPPTLREDAGAIVGGFVGAAGDALKAIPGIVGINLRAQQAVAEPTALTGAVRDSFTASSGGHAALAGLAFMVFVLLYTPCIAAAAAARHEFGSRWMWVSVLGQFAIAWAAALIVFQGGRLLGLG